MPQTPPAPSPASLLLVSLDSASQPPSRGHRLTQSPRLGVSSCKNEGDRGFCRLDGFEGTVRPQELRAGSVRSPLPSPHQTPPQLSSIALALPRKLLTPRPGLGSQPWASPGLRLDFAGRRGRCPKGELTAQRGLEPHGQVWVEVKGSVCAPQKAAPSPGVRACLPPPTPTPLLSSGT